MSQRNSALFPSSLNLRAFTVLNAVVAVFSVDADDAPVTEVARMRVDALPIEPMVQRVPVMRHGSPWVADRAISQTWGLSITRPVAIHLDSTVSAEAEWEPVMNQRYALVVVWHDPVRALWEKMVFLGVTGDPAALDADHIRRTIALRAERRKEPTAGRTAPDFTIATTGEVVWVAADTTRTTLYTYSAGEFTNVASTSGRAEIVVDGDGFTLSIASTDVIIATPTEFTVSGEFIAGATFADTLPRVEFIMDGVRRMTVTAAGNVHCADLDELNEAPAAEPGGMDVTTSDDQWLFSLRTSGISVPEIVEA